MAGPESRKEELIAALARSRGRMDAAGGTLHHALDFPTRLGRSFAGHKWLWLGGAVLLGVAVTRLPRRSPKVKVQTVRSSTVKGEDVAKTGMGLAIAKVIFDLARPVLLKVVMEQVRPWVEQQFARKG